MESLVFKQINTLIGLEGRLGGIDWEKVEYWMLMKFCILYFGRSVCHLIERNFYLVMIWRELACMCIWIHAPLGSAFFSRFPYLAVKNLISFPWPKRALLIFAPYIYSRNLNLCLYSRVWGKTQISCIMWNLVNWKT